MRQRIAAALKARRIELGWTQTQAGAVLGVSGVQWRKWEIGADRITADQLAKACEAMLLPPQVALGFDGLEWPEEDARDQAIRNAVAQLRALSDDGFRSACRLVSKIAETERPIP
jgi:transcriptional regulator with XRE-family HTH domain